MYRFINATITIAARDFTKFLKDRGRIIASLIFPAIFTGILGSANQASFGDMLPYNFLLFTFIGTMTNTMYQSTTQGIVSLLEDRETDFAQEMFVAPISRFTIIFGKIMGETLVATVMLISQLSLVFILQIPFDFTKLLPMFPALLLVAMLGGSLGMVIISFLTNQKSANQIFGFILFPQFFLAGIFTPVKEFEGVLFYLSRIAPLTYGVDLVRNIYYGSNSVAGKSFILFPIWVDFFVVISFFLVFSCMGVYMFIRNEKNK